MFIQISKNHSLKIIFIKTVISIVFRENDEIFFVFYLWETLCIRLIINGTSEILTGQRLGSSRCITRGMQFIE